MRRNAPERRESPRARRSGLSGGRSACENGACSLAGDAVAVAVQVAVVPRLALVERGLAGRADGVTDGVIDVRRSRDLRSGGAPAGPGGMGRVVATGTAGGQGRGPAGAQDAGDRRLL